MNVKMKSSTFMGHFLQLKQYLLIALNYFFCIPWQITHDILKLYTSSFLSKIVCIV